MLDKKGTVYEIQKELTLLDIDLVTEGVETQRGALDTVGQLDRLVQVLNSQNGDEGAEAFLGAQRILNGINLNNSGLDKQLLLIHSTTHKDLALSTIKHRLKTGERSGVHDARVIGRVLRTIGVELLVGILELLDNLRNKRLVDQQVVLRCAELAGVQELTPKHATSHKSGIGGLGHDGRVHAAQLEDDGGQMRCGRLGDDSSNVGTTGEEDLVPPFGEQGLCLRNGTLDHCVARGVETGLDDLLHNSCAAGRIFARLDHDCITGGDGTDDGAESQLKGEVEGTMGRHSLTSEHFYALEGRLTQ